MGFLMYVIDPRGIAAAQTPLHVRVWGSITGAVRGRGHAGCQQPAAGSLLGKYSN